MKKCLLFMMLLIFLGSCGIKAKAPTVSEDKKEHYTAEKYFPEDIPYGYKEIAGWRAGAYYYAIGRDTENQTYGLWQYDFESLSVSKTDLSAGEMRFQNYVQGFVDMEGALHTLCITVKEDQTVEDYYLCTFDKEGNLTDKKNLTKSISAIAEKCPRIFLNTFVLSNGKLLFVGEFRLTARVIRMSDEGKVELNEELGEMTLGSTVLRDNEKFLMVERDINGRGKSRISEVNINSGKRKLITNLPSSNFTSYAEGQDAQMIYYQTPDGIWEYDQKENALNRILSYEDSFLNERYAYLAYQRTDGDWCILYENNQDSSLWNFIRLSKSEDDAIARNELTYAVVGPKDVFMNDAIEFNLTQDQVKVVVKNYESIDQLLMDVISGNIPDLVNLDGMEVYPALKEKDMLEDLGVYLQQDEKLSREDFLPKALEIYENDGRLHAIPYGVVISAMIGDERYLGNREGWNLSQFKEFLESLPDQEMAASGCINQEILYELCYQYLDHFVDTRQNTCDFHTEEFFELLEFTSFFSNYDGSSDFYEKMIGNILDGESILMFIQIGDFEEYELWRTLFPGKGRIIGFPSEDGNGVCIEAGAIAPAMTKACKQKEAAWEFIKFIATKEKNPYYTNIFPSYKSMLNVVFEEARDHADAKKSDMHFSYGAREIDIPYASLSEIGALQELLYSGEAVKGGDEKIIEIICEEAAAYFAGGRSAEKVAELIQNRVELYLSE